MRVETAAGEVIELGTTETTPTIGITDYSRRVTDEFGVTTVVERGFARRMSVRLAVPFEEADALQRRMADLRATPARWVADDRYAWLAARGFYKDFALDLAGSPISYCTLTVEGLAASELSADTGVDPAPDNQPSTLQLLQPVIVTNSVLAASNVAEADHPEWLAATSYPTGARVIRTSTHRIYESVADTNVGDDPAGASGKWLDVGPTNRWAMFDQALGSVTTATGLIGVTLNAGTVNAVALLDVVAATVRVQAPGYDRTVAAGVGAITFLDLPATAGQVAVTIAGAGEVSVGTLLIGRLVGLGLTEASPTAGITDYSRKEVDDFGEVTVVQRAWAKRMTARSLIRTDALDVVANRIAAVRARPSLWIGQVGVDSLTVYGFFKDFSIEVGEAVSKLSLSIEGLSAAAKVAPLGAGVNWPDIADPTGTKPADNADVTGENTSKDTVAVAGRPGADLVATTDINVEASLALSLRQDDLLLVFDVRTLVEGQPVTTSFLSFRQEQRTATTALASKVDLLGAETGDGTGFSLNLSLVKAGNATLADLFAGYTGSIGTLNTNVDDLYAIAGQTSIDFGNMVTNIGVLYGATGTLAQNLSDLGAIVGGVSASVTTLEEAFATDAGGYARFVLRAQVAGDGKTYIAGIAGVVTSQTSELNFVADSFNFVTPNGGNPIKPFSIVGDKVKATNFEADTITYGALVDKFAGEGQQSFDPNSWYMKIPGGPIMQGGKLRETINREVPFSIVFPIPFPNQVNSVILTPHVNSFSSSRDLWLQLVGDPTLYGATCQTQAATSDNMTLDGFDWLAIGK